MKGRLNTQGVRVININNDTEVIWERFKRNEKGPFNDKKVKKKAIIKIAELLFDGNITDEQMIQLQKMVKFEFSWHQSVNIRSLNPIYFSIFCEEYGFKDIGRREIILQEDGKTILYSKDYKLFPEEIQY